MVARTFTFPVVAPAANYVAQLAASMSSNTLSTATLGRAGTAATRINESVGDLGQTFTANKRAAWNNYASSNNYLLQWSGKAHCDGTNWWFGAGTTGNVAGNQTMIAYYPATDEFRHWTGTGGGDSTGIFGYGSPHNFEGSAWNPVTGRLYRMLYPLDGTKRVAVWNPSAAGSGVSGFVEQFQWTWTTGVIYPSLECHPGMGSQGTLLALRHGGTNIYRIDLANKTDPGELVKQFTSSKPCICYHTTSTHANGFVYFTSGDADLKFWKIAANGTITACANTPTRMNTDGDGTTDHTILCPLGQYVYAFKLVNGATGRGIYRYDPNSNVWTNTGTDVSGLTLASTWFTVGPLVNEGVALIAYGTSGDGSTHAARIWKP